MSKWEIWLVSGLNVIVVWLVINARQSEWVGCRLSFGYSSASTVLRADLI